MDTINSVAFMVYIPILLQLLVLLVTVSVDSYISKNARWIMLLIILLVSCLVVQDYSGYLLDIDGTKPFLRTLVAIFGYSIRPMIIPLFFYIVYPKHRYRAAWALIAVNTLIHITALFSGICFSIDADNTFHRGVLGYSCHIVSAVLMIQLVYLSLRDYSRVHRADSLIPIANAALIILSVGIDTVLDYREYPISFLTIAVVMCTLFYYIWLHLQFVRRHEQALQAEQRIQIMMTQIQPHFIYNTIATFKALCRIDPARAEELADKFGSYLRQNLDSLDVQGCIPFERELQHTKLYADIEMVRFENIHVDYDIRDPDFLIPPLVLQPMVENAIKHGVRSCEDGRVLVMTRLEEDGHVIEITDNGVGFDPNRSADPSGRSHIGLANVRERVAALCGGTLTIDSAPGEGTSVRIRIPLNGKEKA